MRIVLDTNVLVSGLLHRTGNPAGAVDRVRDGRVKVLYDARILDEYRDVLGRPKLRIAVADQVDVLRLIDAKGERVEPEPYDGPLPDPKDRPFLEVALSGGADALVTGNARHFPADAGVAILSPAELLKKLEAVT